MMPVSLPVAGVWSYLLLFALSAGESSAFLGLVVPGETFVLAAGALASRGALQWPWLAVAVVAGAILGDSLGYGLGKRFGGCRDEGWLARLWSCRRMGHARRVLDRWGGPTIVVGRFVGFLRPVVPFAAGAVRMPYRSFFVFNVIGAVIWSAGTLAAGYFGDAAVRAIVHSFGVVAGGAIVVAVIAIVVVGRRLRPGRGRAAPSPSSSSPSPTGTTPWPTHIEGNGTRGRG